MKILIVGVLSSLVLIFSFILEKFFNIYPCAMCFYERLVYVGLFFTVLLFVLMIFLKKQKDLSYSIKFTKIILFTLLGIGVFLGIWHFGIEQGWFPVPSFCKTLDFSSLTREEIKSGSWLYQNPLCNEIQLKILGLSLAGWNIIVMISSILLLVFLKK